MAKYREKIRTIEAEPYKPGMEDGYACYEIFNGKFIGYFEKDGPLPKTNRRPAIKTTSGWIEVNDGDYIIYKNNDKYLMNSFFEEFYEPVE